MAAVEPGLRRAVGRTLRRTWSVAVSHPALSAFALALVVRVIVAVAVVVWSEGAVFGDDLFYWTLAREIATGELGWGGDGSSADMRNGAFVLPLVILYRILGPSELVAPLWVALLGAVTAALVAAVARDVAGHTAALAAGAALALYPSIVLWSSITLKDSSVWAVLAGLAWVVARAADRNGWLLLPWGAAAAALLLLMAYLRWHTMVVMMVALAVGAWCGPSRGRFQRGVGSLVLVLTLPALLGLGPGGWLIVTSAGSLVERRMANAQGAETAFVEPTPVPAATAVAGRGGERGGSGGGTRWPAVVDTPIPYPPGEAYPMERDADLRHLPRGLSVMIFEPYPWQAVPNLGMRLARWENLLWYPLLALAALGLSTLRRRSGALAYPVLVGVGMALLYALVEGNFGTAYRHRAEFAWVVILLAGLGVARFLRSPQDQESKA